MRLDQLSVALRPRTPWEAMDLGQALVRRHAAAIWKPWFALTLPAFVLCNAIAWWAGPVWLGAVAMWWLKPLFDRVPLYVLSRAVFGVVPGTGQTLRSPQVWAAGQLVPWLTWRRLDPGRALNLPVDLLEAPRGAARTARVRVLQQAIQSPAWGLSLMGLCMELALFLSLWSLALLILSPIEMLPESARVMMETFFDTPPRWAQLCVNAAIWLGTSAIEPFYVGAGFGMYLNRRTQLEAWDVELAFRRLAERAQALGAGTMLAVLLALAPLSLLSTPAAAQDASAPVLSQQAKAPADDDAEDAKDAAEHAPQPVVDERAVLGRHYREHDDAFSRSVDKAYQDETLAPHEEVKFWRSKDQRPDAPPQPVPAWLKPIGQLIAVFGEFGIWIVAGSLLAWLLLKAPAWLPWVRELRARAEPPTPVVEHADAVVEALPSDVPAAVRALWHAGRQRAALALLYRASVEQLANALGKPLPPGATEAECLRRARGLPEAPRGVFGQVVRMWQGAAYGHRLPDGEAFEALLATWTRAVHGGDFGQRA
jgi:hypothetical protein